LTLQQGFLNQRWVQEALGVPLNFTLNSPSVQAAFLNSGDGIRYGIEYINRVAQGGVKVALVNGDRDYRCACMWKYA